MTMQGTSSFVGHLYKRGAASGSSWTNRYVELMLNTGTMKFYAEKSGKRTIKGQINIRKGALELVDQSLSGRPFTIQIVIEDLIGKVEDAEFMLAADSEELFKDWVDKITSCLSDKSKGIVHEGIGNIVQDRHQLEEAAQEQQQQQQQQHSSNLDDHAHDDEHQPDRHSSEQHRHEEHVDEHQQQHEGGGSEEDKEAARAAAAAARRQKAMQARAKATTPDAGDRKPVAIFKSPKFKSLLNDNGLDEHKAQVEAAPEPSAEERQDLLRRQKSAEFIFVRPVEQMRMGYLLKQTSKEKSEDSWVNQYITLDVTVGTLSYYAEISGKRILRGKIDMLTSTYKNVDFEVCGKFYTFGVYDVDGNELSVFNAEDKQAYKYWIQTFDDCNDPAYIQNMKSHAPHAVVAEPTIDVKGSAKNLLKKGSFHFGSHSHSQSFHDLSKSKSKSGLESVGEHTPGVSPRSPRAGREPALKPEVSAGNSIEATISNDDPPPPKSDNPMAVAAAAAAAKRAAQARAKAEAAAAAAAAEEEEEPLPQPVSSNPIAAATAAAAAKRAAQAKAKAEVAAAATAAMQEDPLPQPVSSNPMAAATAAAAAKRAARQAAAAESSAGSGGGDDTAAAAAIAGSVRGTHRPSVTVHQNRSSFTPFSENAATAAAAAVAAVGAIKSPSPVPPLALEAVNTPAAAAAVANAHPAENRGSNSVPKPSTTSIKHMFGSADEFDKEDLDAKPYDPNMSFSVHKVKTKDDSHVGVKAPGTAPASSRQSTGGGAGAGIATGAAAGGAPPHPSGNDSPVVDVSEQNLRLLRQMNGMSPAPQAAIDNGAMNVENALQLVVKRVRYPAERLNRRIKIWYCSSGFSLSTAEEVDQFVNELQQSGDAMLQAFSNQKFGNISDWANLLDTLRQFEDLKVSADVPAEGATAALQKQLREGEGSQSLDTLSFTLEASLPYKEGSEPVLFEFNEECILEHLAKDLAVRLKIPEVSVSTQLPVLLTEEGNPLQKGLGLLRDDLTFAEDLLLYQEEVIDHLWESYSALKGAIEQKDEAINNLYEQVAAMQEQELLNAGDMSVAGIPSHAGGKRGEQRKKKLKGKELLAAMEQEFQDADKDGDGTISKEEWRKWMEDKHALIAAHNETKSSLLSEIKTLRKTVNAPNAEQAYVELRRAEASRAAMETELFQVSLQNDELRGQLAAVISQLMELESERALSTSVWEERIRGIEDQHAQALAAVKEEAKAARAMVEQLQQQQQQQMGAGGGSLPSQPPQAPAPAPAPPTGASRANSIMTTAVPPRPPLSQQQQQQQQQIYQPQPDSFDLSQSQPYIQLGQPQPPQQSQQQSQQQMQQYAPQQNQSALLGSDGGYAMPGQYEQQQSQQMQQYAPVGGGYVDLSAQPAGGMAPYNNSNQQQQQQQYNQPYNQQQPQLQPQRSGARPPRASSPRAGSPSVGQQEYMPPAAPPMIPRGTPGTGSLAPSGSGGGGGGGAGSREHPLRAALRTDQLNRLGGNGKALANSKSSFARQGSPSRTNKTHFMGHTSVSAVKHTPQKEVDPAKLVLTRNSGGWKWA